MDERQAVPPCRPYQASLSPEAAVLPKSKKFHPFYTNYQQNKPNIAAKI